MEGITELIHHFVNAFTAGNLLSALIGVTIGTFVGVLPGIGPAVSISLLLPLTFSLPASSSLLVFGGIYYGVMYGGSTTSILLRTPGEVASIFTAFEGNKMARAGKAGVALMTAAMGSFVAGTVATLALAFAAPYVVALALRLGPADYFALMMVALFTISVLLGESISRGLGSLALGLVTGLIGLDAQSGMERYTLGLPRLASGIDNVTLVVGIFAVGGVLYYAAYRRKGAPQVLPTGRVWMSREDWRRSWPAWLRGTALGWPLGAVPVGGAELPTFLSYTIELRRYRRRHSAEQEAQEGGIIECVAGPEAANNANAAGVLMPLLTLGIPTSTTAAVLIVAFQQYGLRPGPLLLESQPELVWGLIAALLVGNAMLLVLNLPLVGVWAAALRIRAMYLNAAILVFAALGAYTLRGNTFQIYLMLIIGLVGVVISRFGYPVAPLIIAAILGPMAEVQLRRALQISNGDVSVLVSTPFTVVAYVLMVVIGIIAVVRARRRRRLKYGTAIEPADSH